MPYTQANKTLAESLLKDNDYDNLIFLSGEVVGTIVYADEHFFTRTLDNPTVEVIDYAYQTTDPDCIYPIWHELSRRGFQVWRKGKAPDRILSLAEYLFCRNDLNQPVFPIGAWNSQERTRARYPKLIEYFKSNSITSKEGIKYSAHQLEDWEVNQFHAILAEDATWDSQNGVIS